MNTSRKGRLAYEPQSLAGNRLLVASRVLRLLEVSAAACQSGWGPDQHLALLSSASRGHGMLFRLPQSLCGAELEGNQLRGPAHGGRGPPACPRVPGQRAL